MSLNITVLPTYNINTMGVVDSSIYSQDPPNVTNPTLEVEVPNFGTAYVPFNVNGYMLLDSSVLGISTTLQPLPDGIYKLKYTVAPAYNNYVNKTFIRIDKIQEKFDSAFLKLDLLECDGQIKKQAAIELNTIYYYIQGAVASANNCSTVEAMTLYRKADRLLTRFINGNCGCSPNHYY